MGYRRLQSFQPDFLMNSGEVLNDLDGIVHGDADLASPTARVQSLQPGDNTGHGGPEVVIVTKTLWPTVRGPHSPVQVEERLN